MDRTAVIFFPPKASALFFYDGNRHFYRSCSMDRRRMQTNSTSAVSYPRNKEATEMSSSMMSQCMPIPLPIRRQFFLCSSDASRSLGNHSSGALISLPSRRRTWIMSESNHTSAAIASEALTAKVPMPFLLEKNQIFQNQPFDFIYFPGAVSDRFSQSNGFKPKLGIIVAGFNMNMDRL